MMSMKEEEKKSQFLNVIEEIEGAEQNGSN